MFAGYQFGNNMIDLAGLRNVRWSSSESERPRVVAYAGDAKKTGAISIRPDYPVVTLLFAASSRRQKEPGCGQVKFVAVEALLVWWWFRSAQPMPTGRDRVVFTCEDAIGLAGNLPTLWSTIDFAVPENCRAGIPVESWVRDRVWPSAFAPRQFATKVRRYPGSDDLVFREKGYGTVPMQAHEFVAPGKRYLVQPRIWLRDLQDNPGNWPAARGPRVHDRLRQAVM